MSQSENSGCESNVVGAVSQLETLSLEQNREITFVFPGEKIRVSEKFLAASSPIFKAMFEDGKDEVPITDMHPDTFKSMLLYINGSDLPEYKEPFNNLLAAAEKYELHKVNNLRLMSNITKYNWFETVNQAFSDANLELLHALSDFFWMVPHMEVVAYAPEFVKLRNESEIFLGYFMNGWGSKSKTPELRFDSHYDISGSIKSTKIILEKRVPDISYFHLENVLTTPGECGYPRGYFLNLFNSICAQDGEPPVQDGQFLSFARKDGPGHPIYSGMKISIIDGEIAFQPVPHATDLPANS